MYFILIFKHFADISKPQFSDKFNNGGRAIVECTLVQIVIFWLPLICETFCKFPLPVIDLNIYKDHK